MNSIHKKIFQSGFKSKAVKIPLMLLLSGMVVLGPIGAQTAQASSFWKKTGIAVVTGGCWQLGSKIMSGVLEAGKKMAQITPEEAATIGITTPEEAATVGIIP